MSTYNGVAFHFDGDGETLLSLEAVSLDRDGKVMRAAGFWSAYAGTDAYELHWVNGHTFSGTDSIRIYRMDPLAAYTGRWEAPEGNPCRIIRPGID